MLLPYDQLPAQAPWRLLRDPRLIRTASALRRPSRRFIGNLDTPAPLLRLWTIQSRAAYAVLQRDGILHNDPVFSEPHYRHAYSWLEQQAERKLPTPPGSLLWLWARTTASHIRRCASHADGHVLLEVLVPRRNALLSDFELWHTCLNGFPHVPPQQGEPREHWIRRIDTIYDLHMTAKQEASAADDGGATLDLLRQLVTWTWAPIADPMTFETTAIIQANVYGIRGHQVIRATRIRRSRLRELATSTVCAFRRRGGGHQMQRTGRGT